MCFDTANLLAQLVSQRAILARRGKGKPTVSNQDTPSVPRRLYTLTETGAALRLGKNSINKLVKEQKLDSVCFGLRRRLISVDSVEKFIARGGAR